MISALKDFLKPNTSKILIAIFLVILTGVLLIVFVIITPDCVKQNECQYYLNTMEFVMATPLAILILPTLLSLRVFGFKNNTVLVIFNILYLYLLSCVIYYVLRWIKNMTKKHNAN